MPLRVSVSPTLLWFRQDLRFGKSMRKYAEQGTAAMVKVVAMLVVSGLIWTIQNKLNPFAGK